MTRGTVVLLGGVPDDLPALDLLVAEFGWSLKEAEGLKGLVQLTATGHVVSVLFNPRDLELPWDHALRAVLEAAPRALPILCHGFADVIEWPEAAESGAFHSLRLPLDLAEVRQSLGFVSARRMARGPLQFDRAPADEPSSVKEDAAAGMVA